MNQQTIVSQSESEEIRTSIFWAFFSAIFSLAYLVADLFRLPIFSYYPATQKFTWGFTPSTMDDGPAMYWYGWILFAFINAIFVAFIIRCAPISLLRRIPISVAWILPTALIPLLLYSLKFYWR